ncbi:DUF1993 family protein [Rhizobium sp. CRIBSB]|nr:DUF1993 family protein [Rhizobium sp. CRIBSB]
MSLSMHDLSVPVFLRGLSSLSSLLDKAEAEGFDTAALMTAKLADDMRPFPDQIQMASFSARGAVARLAGVDWPKTADDEADFAQLRATIKLTTDFLNSITPEQLEGSDTRELVLKFPSIELTFTGAGYLTSFAIPNFYFHVTTAYAILRNQGVALGKRDFLGQLALTQPPVMG